MGGMGNFLKNTLGKLDVHDGQLCEEQKHVRDELKEANHNLQNPHHEAEVKGGHLHQNLASVSKF